MLKNILSSPFSLTVYLFNAIIASYTEWNFFWHVSTFAESKIEGFIQSILLKKMSKCFWRQLVAFISFFLSIFIYFIGDRVASIPIYSTTHQKSFFHHWKMVKQNDDFGILLSKIMKNYFFKYCKKEVFFLRKTWSKMTSEISKIFYEVNYKKKTSLMRILSFFSDIFLTCRVITS